MEPARLRALHGDAFDRYLREVPALLPRWRPWPGSTAQRWSAARTLANREHWMIVALAAVVAFLSWRAY